MILTLTAQTGYYIYRGAGGWVAGGSGSLYRLKSDDKIEQTVHTSFNNNR